MTPAAVVDMPALAAAVQGGRWAEVRAAAAAAPAPLPPAVALVAARAAARTGAGAEALAVLRSALPRAGELAAALRLEAGAIALERGETPWPWVYELTRAGVPAAHRRAAGELLRRAWQHLPVATLRRQQHGAPLPRALRRDLAATLALRTGDRAGAIRLLREGRGDEPAARVAVWLAAQPGVTAGVRLHAGEALLAAGYWSEAEALLAAPADRLPAHLDSRLAYLRGRAAYRNGRLATAAPLFDRALARAGTGEERFNAAVQRARVAERLGDVPGAVPLWDAARQAAPQEVEGWDGGARARAALERGAEAVALATVAPPKVLRVAGPRLAALLLARGELERAGALLARLPARLPARRALAVALAARRGDTAAARAAAREVIADGAAGAWRTLALAALPVAMSAPAGTPPPSREMAALATTAVDLGVGAARGRLAAALAADPAWSALVTGAEPDEPVWSGPARALTEVGLGAEAAALYAPRFPSVTPADLAWSAATLAAWGNGPAALSAGERLLAALGNPPPALVPDAVLRRVLPAALTRACRTAGSEAAVPAAWMVGIVRRESRFDAVARSHAGALGIAQVVPETARRLGAAPAELLDGERALALAAREVARLASRFGARLPEIAAAYNAGDEVVAGWLAALGNGADELTFAAAVPYRETADYVLAVAEGAAMARHLE
jgi:soluble lytic murein transglycosylase-like protein/tetratricopeptide (TPR) repeat protein